ncbi:D-alanyl-D-alanine carboxypeptidase family protein [Maledivibacter halophilus]|uniref:serine-type D-Ala-D-Ala carboxypeptidase n=1 Tax=Maledivibacter halophilus TaxID=36842 RepID=A0A1T5KMM4_9FIRM|nr:D-alanyl-D-alanine carboxypeptidase family protein [Maledivibacter halophilus]SKC64735.1 D-alanyl-D-alanine carboxypeptidase (penicillin-binding protein 5/6) [Maledivibacter halophilus]
MKRLFVILFIVTVLISSSFSSFAITPAETIDISAESGILIDFESGDILFEKNPHKQMYPASTTKIMTAILTLENTNLDDKVVIDKEAPFIGGSRIYVKEGEVFTVEQLLNALLIESANDAAVALAKHISGSTEEFARLMNKRAKELGALNTHFTNPNGLPDEKHVTTAYDLAMISKYAMTIPKFKEIVKTVRYEIPANEKTPEIRYFRTTNRLLWGVGPSNRIEYNGKWVNIKYDIVDGIKTGYTDAAQQCLVSTAAKDNRRVISVVLKAIRTNVYVDSRKLIDYGLDNFKIINLVNSGTSLKTIEIENGIEKDLSLLAQDNITKTVPNNYNETNISSKIELDPEIKAPINKGEVLGKVSFSLDGAIIGETNLIANKSIEEKQIYKIIRNIKDPKNMSLLKIILSLILIFIVWRTIVTVKRIRRRRRRWKL